MNDYSKQTLAAIVSANHQTVPVFEKYHLDFCCQGKRKLEDACWENNVDVQDVINELNLIVGANSVNALEFDDMTVEELTDYIVARHHVYVRQSMPLIHAHLEKVARKHGDRFPYMIEVLQLFSEIREDMGLHMQKEESILFPALREVEKNLANGKWGRSKLQFLITPIAVMESEHESAGRIMDAIRVKTNDFTAPVGACMTFNICLNELKEFEEDLHCHVHLENNILFPKISKWCEVVG